MKRLYAIDPASHRTGLAVFHDGKLAKVALIKAGQKADYIQRVHEIAVELRSELRSRSREDYPSELNSAVIEWPKVYREGSASKANPDDVLKIAGVAAVASSILLEETVLWPKDIRRVLPSEWKGQAPKFTRASDGAKIYSMWTRMMPVLTGDEKVVVVSSGYQNDDNVLDAIGIGLFHLERM